MASSKTLAQVPSLRDRQKTETRRVLHDTALKLFAAQGYDATTTEEIAEKAGVSARTFFRYFPTKESVLLADKRDWFQSAVKTCSAQPASLSNVDAMCLTLVGLAPDLVRRRRALLLYKRALASSPALRGRMQDYQREDIENLAEAIAARRGLPGADRACVLLAAVGLLAYNRAVDAWLTGPTDTDLDKVIIQEFGLLEQQFGHERETRSGHDRRSVEIQDRGRSAQD